MSYLNDAQRRSRRRQSLWNWLLLAAALLFLVVLTTAGAWGATWLHQALYPTQTLRNASGWGVILAMCGPFFGALPAAMLAANACVQRLRPAREALAREAGDSIPLGFAGSQGQLLRATRFLLPCAVAITLCGALSSW